MPARVTRLKEVFDDKDFPSVVFVLRTRGLGRMQFALN